MYMNDEVAEASNEPQSADKAANLEVKSSLKEVQVPLKGGSPAFSIHADKVYILYPSLFQDPNIFGRFSIPQNINLDPLPDKKVTKVDPLQAGAPSYQPPMLDNFEDMFKAQLHNDEAVMNPQNFRMSDEPSAFEDKKVSKRQTANPTPKSNDDKKRNVESHLTGTIVVFNQDVNEHNRKDSY